MVNDTPRTPYTPIFLGRLTTVRGPIQFISGAISHGIFFMMSDVDRIKRTKEYRSIRTSLIDQLERSGNDLPHFLNMVEDYMSMYVTKELCKADIADRGISVTSIGSTGQLVTKKNDSADLLLKTNQQMIKLLDMLGIKPDAGLGAEDEEM